MVDDPKRRVRTPPRGVPVDPDAPPQEMPAIARSRTPTPDEVSNALDAFELQLTKRMDQVETDLKANTRSTVRSEALLEILGGHIDAQTAKLETCLHYIAASSHVAASVAGLGEKIDTFGPWFAAIDTAQRVAAVRFEEHDKRDQEIEATVGRIETRVGALEQTDKTAKISKALIAKHNKWRPRLIKAVGGAVIAGLGALATLLAGGCT